MPPPEGHSRKRNQPQEDPHARQAHARTIVVASICAAIGAAGGIAGVSAATGDDASGGSGGSAGADQRSGPGPGHVGPNGVREHALSGDVAQKVRDAALAKVDGGTVERVETDADHGSPYEAHVRRSDGTELEVLVNEDFSVTAVKEMQHP
jgi:hypothetical protein